jgi:hypothetical protein
VEDAPVAALPPPTGASAIIGTVLALVLVGAVAWETARAETASPSTPKGLVWGRLAVEAESPEGERTPLAGVEVTAYPHAPALLAELERIRDGARDSARLYDSAIGRLQEVLRAHAAQVDPDSTPQAEGRASPDAAAPTGPEERQPPGSPPAGTPRPEGLVKRRVTDPAGSFAFEELPDGEWLLVAIRVSPYGPGRTPRADPRAAQGRRSGFAARATVAPAQEAEVWLMPVRVQPGDRVRVLWTDRSRFMTGPLRGR